MATKVLICLPSAREPKAGTLFDLAKLVNTTRDLLPDVKISFATGSSSLIHDLRRDLVNDALKFEADWVFFLDDDMRFPPDALVRLLRHRRDIVGCNYVTRSIPPKPTAKMIAPDAMRFTMVPTLETDAGLAEVDALGFGCILINTRVFKAMPQPWFSMPWVPQLGYHVGEDVFFCVAAGKHDFKVFVDHDLSKEIKHVGNFEFSWDHFYGVQELDAAAQELQNG
jgi:glycosyltransferase involved in cell wall biosynthesis